MSVPLDYIWKFSEMETSNDLKNTCQGNSDTLNRVVLSKMCYGEVFGSKSFVKQTSERFFRENVHFRDVYTSEISP